MVTKQSMQEIEHIFAEWTPSQLMDHIPGSTYLKDLEGTIVACSHHLHEDLSQDPVGKTDYELQYKEDADQLRENDKKVMKSQQTMAFIERGRGQKGGEPTLYLSLKAPLFDNNGHVIGIIGHSTKITPMSPL